MYKIFKIRTGAAVLIILFMILLLIFSEIGVQGVNAGINLSANIIIPSLFPYTFAVLFLMRINISHVLKPFERITVRLFNMDATRFTVFILSFLGGYPCGAKLINELYKNKSIDSKTANNMLLFCVNAGPGYILIAVGNKVLNSKVCGIILLVSHVLASIIIAIALKKHNNAAKHTLTLGDMRVSNAFVTSIRDSADTVLNICFFVVIFSVFGTYLNSFSGIFPVIKYLTLFTEVTTAVALCKNVYLISFLLGFSGISIWCQVLSVTADYKIYISKFVISRVMHGLISSLLTYIAVLIIKPVIPTVSTANALYPEKANPLRISISLLLMLIIFIISSENKITCRKIKNDLL